MLIESSKKNGKFNEREILWSRLGQTQRHIQIIHFYFDGILKISPNLPLCVTNDNGLSSANAGFRERYGLLLKNKSKNMIFLFKQLHV